MKKNFKKIAAVALSCVLTLGMTVNAFAADVDQFDSRKGTSTEPTNPTGTLYKFSTEDSNTSTRDVTVAIGAPTTIYRVDVEWESTSFTFKFDGEWSPETHKYGTNGTGNFYAGTDMNNSKDNAKITVTNHSNAGVKAKFVYTPETSTNGFSAALYTTSTKDAQKSTDASALASADLGASLGNPDKAPNDVAYLVVGGAPETLSVTDAIKIGTITITINKN